MDYCRNKKFIKLFYQLGEFNFNLIKILKKIFFQYYCFFRLWIRRKNLVI